MTSEEAPNHLDIRDDELGARSRGELEVLQLIVNGKVVAQRAGPDARDLVLEEAVHFDRSSWAAVRAFERSDRSEVFAHTSPLYFLLEGRPVVVSDSVGDLVQKIDLLIEHAAHLEGFRQEVHRKATLEVYRQARDVLRQRLVSP